LTLDVGRVLCRRGEWVLLAGAMRQCQPLRKKPRSFVWCCSVERHHRGGEAWRATKLRAPSVADGHDLDVVRTPANCFVEAKNCHVCLCPGEVKRVAILRSRRSRSSEASREDRST